MFQPNIGNSICKIRPESVNLSESKQKQKIAYE